MQSHLNVEGINYPVETKQIPLFEQLNPEISVNVLSVDEENENGFCVEYLSPDRNRPHHINLLLLEDQNDPSRKHYTWIKDMSRLVNRRTKHNGRTFVCNSCLHPFQTQEVHDNHLPYCLAHPAQQVVYPVDSPHLKFKSVRKQHMVPFYLACDFESFLSPVDTDDVDVEEEEEDTRGMRLIDEHKVSGFCCYRVSNHKAYQTPLSSILAPT